MYKFIVALFGIMLFSLPSMAATKPGVFLGVDELQTLGCPDKNVKINNHIQIARTEDVTWLIEVNPKDFAKMSTQFQNYVFMHECGHASGISGELGADKWAFDHYLKYIVNQALLDEICDDLQQYFESRSNPRCNQLKKLTKKLTE